MSPKYISNGFHFPYNPNLKENARSLRKNMTIAEKKLWKEFLQLLDIPVLRQRPILDFIADFYIASTKLIIEIDGDSHFSQEGKEYDQIRTEKLESLGIKVIRFSNLEVLECFDGVCARILEELAIPPKSSFSKGGL